MSLQVLYLKKKKKRKIVDNKFKYWLKLYIHNKKIKIILGKVA